MHHMYSAQKGDTLCPLGFHPQVRWPTRCKRCFRDYKEHGGKKGSLRDITSSSPSLSPWEATPSRGSESKRTWASATNLAKEDSKSSTKQETSPGWTSSLDLSSIGREGNDSTMLADKNPRIHDVRRLPTDGEATGPGNFESSQPPRHQKLQIKEVISHSNGTSSDNDVEFIIQVKKTRTGTAGKNSVRDSQDGQTEKGGKTEKANRFQNEIEKLKSQLSEMRARCERAEKEKSEFLLRRLATVDSVANKSEAGKLQKSLNELQERNEALLEEKNLLAAKVRSLEREQNSKYHKIDREKSNDDLKSKLKAAETLCESLMDENEDMKKEIRELEEEIYEMQDNFREEQVDEYTSLRKNLEQSKKNCRILSFKLRKTERRADQLETEKSDFEKKYEEVKKVEEILKKIGGEYKNRVQKKATDFTPKIQLKKMVDDMEKEIGDIVAVLAEIVDGKDVNVESSKTEDYNLKYDKLLKEYEQLKEKCESTTKELAKEVEKKKNQQNSTMDEKKNADLTALRKKLDETNSSREAERKAWEEDKAKLHEEKEKLKSKLLSVSSEKLKVCNEVVQLKKDLEAAKSTGKNTAKIESSLQDLKKELSQEREKCKKLQNDLSSHTARETKITETLTTVEQSKSQLDEETKRLKQELENAKNTSTTKIADLNAKMRDMEKEEQKLKSQLENEKQSKEMEVSALKKKVASLEKANSNTKKLNDMKQSYNEKILNLENEVKKWHQEHDELYERYQELADLKSNLQEEKKDVDSQLENYKRDLNNAQKELENLRNSSKDKENTWWKEKLRLDERIRDLEKTSNKPVINDLHDEINNLKKENSSLVERTEDLKRLNDDLSNKLKDYETVSKVQRNLSADSTALESEIKRLKNALANGEKAKKADLAQCKLRYEHRINAINDEIQTIQNQLLRYKRERDTYKQMMEGAQKTIAELKKAKQQQKTSSASSGRSDEDEASSIPSLERQISSMEDELSESKLEVSKLRTEMVSEKSAWHVKLAEMQSRINELEEERMLTSGRSKIPGLKVRMELAWQKEREEQQRILQETATLARDLRQTLYEVERERDKERLENSRKLNQHKKLFEEEKEDHRKKLTELQCDILELRDAHAKLRTSNEKMRKEKERHEREREELKQVILSKRRAEQSEAKNVNILLQQVDDLMKLFPELNKDQIDKSETYTPTPPRRTKSKSRESSPMLEGKEDSSKIQHAKTEKLEYTIGKLMEVAKELKESKKAFDDVTAKRLQKFNKRSTSVDSDPGNSIAPKRTKPRLKKKSLSLEQTAGKNDNLIWGGTDSNVSSLQSLEGSDIDAKAFSLQRDSSVDSRLSGSSTKSEILPREKKYNKGIIRKITNKIIKSNSVDDPNTSIDSLQTSGSELSINEGGRTEKKNLKKKLSDMFRRGSRSNSEDRRVGQSDSRPSSRASMSPKT
ncbi:myosin-2 heavy chain isoform X2 [Prorops nasuta]|uniref:myosin-2 heavy chain isoform X2 n=1 Tax=Prorops nasuta TaxID=863751 RepID=UPI0034CE4223